MLAHRLRRWANIIPTLAERLVFAWWLFHPRICHLCHEPLCLLSVIKAGHIM